MADYVSSHTGAEIDAAVDRVYVATTGVSSTGWNYRKWSNGKIELWQTISVQPTSSTQTSTGNGYYSNDITLPTLPNAIQNATITAMAGDSCFVSFRAMTSTGYTIYVRLLKFSAISTSNPVTLFVRVEGDLN